MAITNVQLNHDGFKALLQGPEIKELVEQEAKLIEDRANANNTRGGEGFVSTIKVGYYGGGRWVGFIHATDNNSAIAESEDKALTRALQ